MPKTFAAIILSAVQFNLSRQYNAILKIETITI